MTDHLEFIDVFKTLLALAAGMLLGLERELKDKAAGLKTITIICLGATLFSIISFKVGGTEDTRIASYIVSGVGFIGAGVIFKDGLNVSGLTTAGIIWLAAAVGTSIGFGEYYLAGIFLAASLVITYTSTYINRLLSKKQTRHLEFELDKTDLKEKEAILKEISERGIRVEEQKIEMTDKRLKIIADVILHSSRIKWLQEYLLNHKTIKAYSF
jgi:putative Mg2+ transporter-C (MgtC) family protein